jgi:hypothetical protein
MEVGMKLDYVAVGFSPKYLKLLYEAAYIFEGVTSSNEFKDKVVNHEFKRNGQVHNGFFNCSLSGQQVYDRYTSGADMYHLQADKDLDAYIISYYKSNSVVGYTYANTYKTWMNRKFMNLWRLNPQNIAGNIGHEGAHNIDGINYHTKGWTRFRKYSAPYAIGNIIRDLGAEWVETAKCFSSNIDFTKYNGKVWKCKRRWYGKKICGWY